MRKLIVDLLLYSCMALTATAFAIGLALGVVLVLPCMMASMWFADRASDLRGGWARGRDQNRLWRWARRWRGLP